jgi:hypothetical protein
MDPKWVVRVQRAILRIRQLAHRWKVVWALPLSLSQPLQARDLMQERPEEEAGGSHSHQTREDPNAVLSGGDLNSNCFDEYLGGFWDPSQYGGALEQINDSLDIPESWDLDQLFEDGNLRGSYELGNC